MKGGPSYSATSATAWHVAKYVDPAIFTLDAALAKPDVGPDARALILAAIKCLEHLT